MQEKSIFETNKKLGSQIDENLKKALDNIDTAIINPMLDEINRKIKGLGNYNIEEKLRDKAENKKYDIGNMTDLQNEIEKQITDSPQKAVEMIQDKLNKIDEVIAELNKKQ